MDSKDNKAPRNQRAGERHKAIAMTRAINMISDEFIENYSQTGIDDGPEANAKLSPVREALAARERKEAEESKDSAPKQEFRGFASLMANANAPAKSSAFARLLQNDTVPEPESPPIIQPAHADLSMPEAAAGPETTADGAIIKVKDTVGKKRGLYTSCMQKPTEAQMEEMAAKYARPDTKTTSETSDSTEAQMEEMAAKYARPDTETMNDISSRTCVPAKEETIPIEAIRQPAAPIVSQCDPGNTCSSDGSIAEVRTWTKYEDKKSAHLKSKMTYESDCPFACTLGRIADVYQKIVSWIKAKRR